MKGRRAVDDKLLRLLYDFAVALQSLRWFDGPPESPLLKMDDYDRLSIPRRVTDSIRSFSSVYLRHSKASEDFRAFINRSVEGTPMRTFVDSLSPTYTVPGPSLIGRTFGQGPEVFIATSIPFSSLYPIVLRHADDESLAWKEAVAYGFGSTYWGAVFVANLIKNDPATLHRLHKDLLADANASEGQTIVKQLLDAHRDTFYGALALERVLLKRLVWLPWRRRTQFDSPDDEYRRMSGAD